MSLETVKNRPESRLRALLFLDDGGVMNDNGRRAPQWQQLIGEYLTPRLGGSPEGWASANRVVAGKLFEDWDQRIARAIEMDYDELWANYQERWLREMCAEVGVAAPEKREERVSLADAAAAFVTPRVQAAYPGAVTTIRQLYRRGCCLYTASGEHSDALAGYLHGMEVRDCFTTLYGPDLVGKAKAGAFYYERVFTHAGVRPSDALVVDDKEICLDWAAEAGAQTILCSSRRPRSSHHRHIYRLSQLPSLLG